MTIHADGAPMASYHALRAVYPEWLTTAEVAAKIDRSHKTTWQALDNLRKRRCLVAKNEKRDGRGRPTKCWQFVPGAPAPVTHLSALSAGMASSESERRIRKARIENLRQSSGPYVGRDMRYQVPPDWEPPVTGFSGVGIGFDRETGRPWGA